jgi:hypothetical protein
VDNWPALRAARAHDVAARVPFRVNGATVGSVARAHLPALGAWPTLLRVDADGVAMHGNAATLQAALERINHALREKSFRCSTRPACSAWRRWSAPRPAFGAR